MSKGLLRCWTMDPPRHDAIGRRLLRKTGGWIVGEIVKLLRDLPKDVAFMSLDSSEDLFDVSHVELVVDESEISLLLCVLSCSGICMVTVIGGEMLFV